MQPSSSRRLIGALLIASIIAGHGIDFQLEEAYGQTSQVIPAFPGAEGFGARTPGGRGGRVIEVTNLNDGGPGSLRAALEASGPRIVVFRTGGIIKLRTRILITEPYLTVAGQTAPGGGITLQGTDEGESDVEPILIRAHDVIIRYITSRPGPTGKPTCCSSAIQLGSGAENVIVDHSSFSWAVDENFSVWEDAKNVTVQWSIMAEGLHHSTHEKGPHGKGALFGDNRATNFTVHHNLFAHNDDRNPRIKISGPIDMINNVIYNPGGEEGGWAASHVSARSNVNYIGNTFKAGPNTKGTQYYISGDGNSAFYVRGNITTLRQNDTMDEHAGVVSPGSLKRVVSQPFQTTPVTTQSAHTAYESVLADAGNAAFVNELGLRIPRRDSVDTRIVADVRSGGGRIIDHPRDVGGWPLIEQGKAPGDADHDGMPDLWEAIYRFDIYNGSDGTQDRDRDGYTNVEEYLNGTHPGTSNGGTYSSSSSSISVSSARSSSSIAWSSSKQSSVSSTTSSSSKISSVSSIKSSSSSKTSSQASGNSGNHAALQETLLNDSHAFNDDGDIIQRSMPLHKTEGTIMHWLKPKSLKDMIALYEGNCTNNACNGFGSQENILEIHTGTICTKEKDDKCKKSAWTVHYQDGPKKTQVSIEGVKVEKGDWTHVAITWQHDGWLKLYVNGVEVAHEKMQSVPFENHVPSVMQLGAAGNGERNWKGKMEDVRTYSVALNAEEIRDMFEATK